MPSLQWGVERIFLELVEMEAEPRWFCPLERERILLSMSPFLSLVLRRLLKSWQGDLLDGVGDLLGLLERGGVISLCLDVKQLCEMGRCEVLQGDEDLLLLGDLELLELSG